MNYPGIPGEDKLHSQYSPGLVGLKSVLLADFVRLSDLPSIVLLYSWVDECLPFSLLLVQTMDGLYPGLELLKCGFGITRT